MTRIERWPDGPAARSPRPGLAGAEHPSRHLLTALLETDQEEAAAGLRAEYDRQAPDWAAWTGSQPDYALPMEDVLQRRPDLIGPDDVVLEVGAGTGELSRLIAPRTNRLLTLDIAWEMARRLRRSFACVQADARRLPLRAHAVDVVAGLNAVPCWAEFRRVLRANGRVLWLSSFGMETPIVVTPMQLAAGLPEAAVTWARAGHGFWIVAEGVG